MWLGIAVGRHCVCETGVGAGERYMLLGVAVGRECLCGGQAAVGGARGEKQLGNGAGRHCV